MKRNSVHYPVNEVDNQFEGNVVVHPGGCFGTCPLDVRFGDPFVVDKACSDTLNKWHRVVSHVGLSLQNFADYLSQCETAIVNISSLSAFNDGREMQTLQNKRSEWVGLSGPNVHLVISTKSATDEVASITLSKMTEIDVSDAKLCKSSSKIELGFTTDSLLKQLLLSKKSKVLLVWQYGTNYY